MYIYTHIYIYMHAQTWVNPSRVQQARGVGDTAPVSEPVGQRGLGGRVNPRVNPNP